jgi:hypothetical protein
MRQDNCEMTFGPCETILANGLGWGQMVTTGGLERTKKFEHNFFYE